MPIPARLQRILAILGGALCACWPAFLNRYPLLYFGDSIYYFGDGRVVANALLHHVKGIYAGRSEIYSLGIFLAHWNRSAWPVVALQAVLTSYVVFLVFRSILPRRSAVSFLILMASLSALTSISWYVSEIMPDILGAPLYLSIYLLLFARDTLSRIERWTLAPLVVWFIASHITHIMAMACLCAALALLLFLGWRPMAHRGRALAEVTAMVCLAMVALLALHGYLYRRLTLSGNRPPFLMARIIADGPGEWYLQAHCATLDWYVCTRVNSMPEDHDHFLWDAGSVWSQASYADKQRLSAEEAPLVRGALRAYPRAEIERALANSAHQFIHFTQLKFYNQPVMDSSLYSWVPGAATAYPRSLQANDALPIRLFTRIHSCAVIISAVAIVALLPLVWRHRRQRLIALTIVIAIALVANAFVSAVFSGPVGRYQERIVWLVPMLAALMALDLFGETPALFGWKPAASSMPTS